MIEDILRHHPIHPLDSDGQQKGQGHDCHGQDPSAFGPLQSRVRSAYRWWAHFVVAHPVKIVLFCLVLTGICAFKMSKTKHKNDIRGYTPYGARALHEFDVRDEFFDQSGVGIRFFVLVVPRNGANMLREDTLRETVEVDALIQHNLTIFNRITGRHEPFARICRRFCTINDPVQMFYIGLREQRGRLARGLGPTQRIRLDYPIATVFGQQLNIQPNFFGIQFAPNSSSSSSARFSNMDRAEMVVLLYRAERIGGWTDEDISDYEMSISNYFNQHNSWQHIRVLTISTSYAQLEVDRSGNIIRSFFGLGLAVMVLCSVFSNSLSAFFMRQFSPYKLPVAVFACLCPFMASGTALGLLFFTGVRNGSILGVTPFLILAIGIDDAFLMIHSWQLASKKRRQGKMPELASMDAEVADQLAEVLENTGPAMLISALTNICADAVGAFTGSPEITLLCVGNIASIVVDFFYQITLFTAVLVLCARWELRHKIVAAAAKNAKIRPPDCPKSDPVQSSTSSSPSSLNQSPAKGLRRSLEHCFDLCTDSYIRWVSSPVVSLAIFAFWVGSLVVCTNAMLKFEINLTTKKLFPPDSPLLEIEKYREEKVLPFYTTAQLFINNPGDLSNASRRHRLDQLIGDMERLQYAYPSESSLYFVRTYEEFEKFMKDSGMEREGKGEEEEEDNFDLSDLDTFLNWPEYRHWRGLLNFHTDQSPNGTTRAKPVLDSFMATVAYHGEELQDWYQRARMLHKWRGVVDQYAGEFNVSVLHDDGLYLDLLENMPTDIWQSALATLLCMGAVCALFMCNAFVVSVTTCVIASVLVETLGLMALMGMTMDPVVMAAVIVSIGFSVDIPAHVSYHFHAAKWPTGDERPREVGAVRAQNSVEQRIRQAFSSVGFPALQASTCTNICVLCLLIVPVYMAGVFVRVLCVCITLCTIHSLCLLPALFSLLETLDILFRRLIGRKMEIPARSNRTEKS